MCTGICLGDVQIIQNTTATSLIIIIMVIFKHLSLKALNAVQDHEGGGGTG